VRLEREYLPIVSGPVSGFAAIVPATLHELTQETHFIRIKTPGRDFAQICNRLGVI